MTGAEQKLLAAALEHRAAQRALAELRCRQLDERPFDYYLRTSPTRVRLYEAERVLEMACDRVAAECEFWSFEI